MRLLPSSQCSTKIGNVWESKISFEDARAAGRRLTGVQTAEPPSATAIPIAEIDLIFHGHFWGGGHFQSPRSEGGRREELTGSMTREKSKCSEIGDSRRGLSARSGGPSKFQSRV
jgi:hypothetical protein